MANYQPCLHFRLKSEDCFHFYSHIFSDVGLWEFYVWLCLHAQFMFCAAQIRDAVLNGISLEDDKRQQFNEIEQVRFPSEA